MDDNRKNTIADLEEKIRRGVPISETEVRETLYLARDQVLLYIARETVSGGVPSRERVRLYNALQNACERHEIMHREAGGENPLVTLAQQWKAACEQARGE